MERGFVKLWRKIMDNKSWSRGAVHRGVMMTLFVKANWKQSYFHGYEVKAGEIAISIVHLADELKLPRTTLQRIIKECIDCAKAAGIKIEPVQGKDIAKLFDYHNGFKKLLGFLIIPLAIKKHKLIKASMLQDIEKNIPCEIDYINGIVCEYGRKYNFKTPWNDKVVEIVHKIENKELVPSFENVKLFDELFTK